MYCERELIWFTLLWLLIASNVFHVYQCTATAGAAIPRQSAPPCRLSHRQGSPASRRPSPDPFMGPTQLRSGRPTLTRLEQYAIFIEKVACVPFSYFYNENGYLDVTSLNCVELGKNYPPPSRTLSKLSKRRRIRRKTYGTFIIQYTYISLTSSALKKISWEIFKIMTLYWRQLLHLV